MELKHREKMELRWSRRATAEEYSIIGVILLLFGISWVAYAYMQPLVFTGPCTTAGPTILPPCTTLSSTALVFYVLGIISIIGGIVLLLIRLRIRIERLGQKSAS
jgi:uncharacterized membrane protein HdeD (DUF308 family)